MNIIIAIQLSRALGINQVACTYQEGLARENSIPIYWYVSMHYLWYTRSADPCNSHVICHVLYKCGERERASH